MIGEPIYYMHLGLPMSGNDEAASKLLATTWEPKLKQGATMSSQYQRCPAVWVDSFCFLFAPGMAEPVLLLGLWDKEVSVMGHKQRLKGLVVAAGGHYERCGQRPVGVEAGDTSVRAAADKELKEEIGIDASLVRETKLLGIVDHVLNDPRTHGMRFVHLRWIEQQPRSSDEIKLIVPVPLSELRRLVEGQITVDTASGEQLGFILNHAQYIAVVMSHPATEAFITKIKEQARAQTPSQYYQGAGFGYPTSPTPNPSSCW